MSQNEKSSTLIGISVSADMAAKLYTAYLGLPTARQSVVDDAVRERKLDKHQAIFEEIFGQKLDHYYTKGCEVKQAIVDREITSMMARLQIDRATACERLGYPEN